MSTTPIRVLVNGAGGKMGRETVQAIQQDPAFILVGENHRDEDLVAKIQVTGPQVVVDFTQASIGYENAKKVIEAGVHPVIGTSGFLLPQVESLQTICLTRRLGGLIAPNFSIGVLLMMQYAKAAAVHFSHAEIIEMHHEQKQDYPAGTAMKTAEMMAEQQVMNVDIPVGKAVLANARGASYQGIPIHSIRLPGIMARQEIIFGSLGETLTIKHDCIDRRAYMPGVLLACKKVIGLTELVYGLENLL